MSLIGEILGGKIRQEMKTRVDQVLKAGDEWSKTAKELIMALDKLTDAIKAGNIDPSSMEPVVKGVKHLSSDTRQLEKSFNYFNKTLEKTLTKIE